MAMKRVCELQLAALLLCVSMGASAAPNNAMPNALANASTYRVKPGDSLDKVIRQTMGESPLKVELLRKAYIQQNPQAFVKTSPPVLRSGVVLAVPNHDDLLRQYLRPRDGMLSDPNDRKNWVRYP
jgi:Tfp pilus assembly protein FimV